MRRWSEPWFRTVDGVSFRVVAGKKEPGDLRIEWRTPAGWKPITMAPAALLVEFFIENEEHLKQFRPHWKDSGHDFFMKYLELAHRSGWESAYSTILADRNAIAAVPRSNGQNSDGTWGVMGWYSEALYREWG